MHLGESMVVRTRLRLVSQFELVTDGFKTNSVDTAVAVLLIRLFKMLVQAGMMKADHIIVNTSLTTMARRWVPGSPLKKSVTQVKATDDDRSPQIEKAHLNAFSSVQPSLKVQ